MSRKSPATRWLKDNARKTIVTRTRVVQALIVSVVVLSTAACGGSRLDHSTLEAAFRAGATAGPAAGGGSIPNAPTAGGTQAPGSLNTPAGPGAAIASGGNTGGAGGNTGSNGNNSGTGKPVSSGRTCSGNEKPINIGTVGEQTGPAGATLANGPQTVAAWASWINKNGGLACHQVKYYIGDAKGDPSKNASLVQQFVEQNNVVAFVQLNGALSGSGGRSYLLKSGVPVIGGDAGDDTFYKSPTWFPQVPQGDTSALAGLASVAKSFTPDQRSKFGIAACQEAAQCTDGAKKAAGFAKQVGLTLVFQASASLLQADYTSVCLNAQKAGVKSLLIAFDGNAMSRFVKSCKSVNYRPVFSTIESAVTDGMKSDPNLDGMVIGSFAKPWTDNSNPSIAQMNAVLSQFAPGVPNSGQAHLGWASAKLLEAASAFFPTKDTITKEDVLVALGKIKRNDLGGITGPLTFTFGKPAPRVACYFTMKIAGGKWAATNDARRFCL